MIEEIHTLIELISSKKGKENRIVTIFASTDNIYYWLMSNKRGVSIKQSSPFDDKLTCIKSAIKELEK